MKGYFVITAENSNGFVGYITESNSHLDLSAVFSQAKIFYSSEKALKILPTEIKKIS